VVARLGTSADAQPAMSVADAELRRDGQLWLVRYHGCSAHLPDVKGLADLVVLLRLPSTEVHVLELAGAGSHDRHSGPLLDATARAAYRRRLAELDEEWDIERYVETLAPTQHLAAQRAALIAELGRATGLGGRSRALGASTTERARKAVTARVRGAIRRVEAVLPELGAHLDRSVITGTTCRYHPPHPLMQTARSARSALDMDADRGRSITSIEQGDGVGGADFDALAAGGAARHDDHRTCRGGAQRVLWAGAQARAAGGAGAADPQRVQRGDRDGDVLAALFGHDQRSATQIAGGEQGGRLGDAAGADMVADEVTGARHVHGVELISRVAAQRRAEFADHREQSWLVAAPLDGGERGDRGQIRYGLPQRRPPRRAAHAAGRPNPHH